MDKRATRFLLAVCLAALVAPTAAQASYFLYTPNVSSGNASGYQIAQATGSLSAVAGSPSRLRAERQAPARLAVPAP